MDHRCDGVLICSRKRNWISDFHLKVIPPLHRTIIAMIYGSPEFFCCQHCSQVEQLFIDRTHTPTRIKQARPAKMHRPQRLISKFALLWKNTCNNTCHCLPACKKCVSATEVLTTVIVSASPVAKQRGKRLRALVPLGGRGPSGPGPNDGWLRRVLEFWPRMGRRVENQSELGSPR